MSKTLNIDVYFNRISMNIDEKHFEKSANFSNSRMIVADFESLFTLVDEGLKELGLKGMLTQLIPPTVNLTVKETLADGLSPIERKALTEAVATHGFRHITVL